MKGFVAYHILQGRHKFVDEFVVASRHRRNGVGKSLLRNIANGPIELIVNRTNERAIVFYTNYGFCLNSHPEYLPNDDELNMRTKSFWKTRRLLQDAPSHDVFDLGWNNLDPNDRSRIIHLLQQELGCSLASARRRLVRGRMDRMRFCLIK